MTRDADAAKAERLARYRRGHLSEYAAALLLIAKGYRVLSRRYQTSSGEIDLIARRGRRLAFVEVKRRPTREACEASISGTQRLRMHRAAEQWLARHPRFRDHDISFDAVFLVAGHWPRHIPNCL